MADRGLVFEGLRCKKGRSAPCAPGGTGEERNISHLWMRGSFVVRQKNPKTDLETKVSKDFLLGWLVGDFPLIGVVVTAAANL